MTTMTEDRLREIIAAYGPDPARWPEDERAPAADLLARSPDVFEAEIREAEAVDQALAALPLPDLPVGLIDRVLANAPEGSDQSALSGRIAPAWDAFRAWLTGAALATLSAGLAIGYFGPDLATPSTDDADLVLTFAMASDGFGEFSDGFSE